MKPTPVPTRPRRSRSVRRREFLRIGLAGFGSLSLSELMRLRARASNEAGQGNTAVILIWLRGGASHLETYDPKPNASSDYRGPFAAIASRTTGMPICELLPRHAQIANRFTILRSMVHTGGGHPSGSLQLLSGDPDAQDKPKPVYPDFMTVAHYLRRGARRVLPNYVGVNAITRYDAFTIAGPAYLGPSYEPFNVSGDPNRPEFEIPNIGLNDATHVQRLNDRVALRQRFDNFRRNLDRSGLMDAVDSFEAQALNLLTSEEAARAFDLSREDPALRKRYGLNQWGQQCLMARRLVEAGVELITTTFDGPLCGRVANWDDHAVNHHVFDAMKFRALPFDQAVTALIEDLYDRGLNRKVLLVVTGEFGRTPRISYVASSGNGVASAAQGVVQPGRDHWPSANSMLFAGGGIQTGQVIGATDSRGEYVVQQRVGPGDFLATLYRHLGIDAPNVALPDFAGRPVPILPEGQPIPQLVSRA